MTKYLAPFLLVVFLAFALPLSVIPAAHAAEAAPAPKAEGKKGDADTSGGRFAGDPIYIHMTPMVLPVINDNGVEQLITLILDVQVTNFDAADAMHSNMPRVEDALMRALYGGFGEGSLRNGKLVDVAKVKSKAVAAVGEVIGVENVRDVLIQSVSQRLL